jgi:AraC-like DNA-binding protein
MIINLLFIITGFFGFLTVVTIISHYSFNRMMNLYLIIIFILVSLRFLLNGFFYFGFLSVLKGYNLNFTKFLIIIIPSFYLYFKNLIIDEKDFFIKKDLVHFVFPFVFLGLNSCGVIIKTLDSLHFYFAFYSVLLVYNASYCFLAYQILNRNIWSKNTAIRTKNDDKNLIKNWTLFLFILQIINVIRLFITLYIEQSFYHHFVVNEEFQWMAVIIWGFIFIKVLISPEILFGFEVYNSISKEKEIIKFKINSPWNREPNANVSVIDRKIKEKVDEKIDLYIDEIERLSIEDEVFKDSKFLLFDFAKKLRIPQSHLGYLFKYHSKISYSDFKNNIRIQYSIRLIESDYINKNTLDALAKEIGYASYNPFLINFKKIVGISPQKYIETIKIN